MLHDKLLDDLKTKTGLGRVFMWILAISFLLNLLQAGSFITMDKSVRTVLTPPEITKPFWVDGKHLSPEYLEQMGEYFIMQYANITPGSIDEQNRKILKHVHPAVYGELEVRFKAAAQKLKAQGISRYFFPKEVRVAAELQQIALIGTVETWVGDKKIPTPDLKAYLVGFEYDGYVTVKELREADPQNPFATPKAQPQDDPDEKR